MIHKFYFNIQIFSILKAFIAGKIATIWI